MESCKTAVEIGRSMGFTAGEMAHRLADGGRLYCIDPYLDGENILAIAERHLRREGLSTRVTFLRCDSTHAVALFPKQVDFIFVDDDHRYEGLRADWAMVRSVLRPGGYAAFHDTALVEGAAAWSEGAIRFFGEVIASDPDYEALERVDSLIIIRRRP